MSDDKKNEWHEQVDFSDLFFKSTRISKEAQLRQDLPGWRSAIMAKISLVNGVLEDEQIEDLFKCIKALRKIDLKHSLSLRYNKGNVGVIKAEYYDLLFSVEMYLDRCVNEKMPFLNIKKRGDEGAF